MKNKLTIGIFLVLIIGGFFLTSLLNEKEIPINEGEEIAEAPKEEIVLTDNVSQESNEKVSVISMAEKRITKKPFGVFITRENSPVQPERFSGYHTGVDFEVFEEEENMDIEVNAVCDGEVVLKRFVSGYGGVLIQDCLIENNSVTILFGHLNIESIRHNIGDVLKTGDTIGFLGREFSRETDGERRHLHLAVHLGNETVLAGYVKNKKDLSAWIDPCKYFCN